MWKEIRFVKWSAKKITFNDGWSIVNISIKKEDFNSLPESKWYVKLVLCEKRNTDEYWNTHYVKLNEWKPDGEKTEKTQSNITANELDDDLPF